MYSPNNDLPFSYTCARIKIFFIFRLKHLLKYHKRLWLYVWTNNIYYVHAIFVFMFYCY